MKPTLTILFLLFLTLNAGAQTNREQTPSEWIKSLSTDMRTVELYRLDSAGVLHINRNAPMNLDSFLYFYSRFEKECYVDSVAEKGFWFADTYKEDRIASENEPGAWWRKWDSMGKLLEQSYKTKAVIRWIHPNAAPPNPFVEFLRKMK